MTHTSIDPRGPSPEALLREAREARDSALADLLTGAAKGLASLAATAVRGLVQAGRSIVFGVVDARRRWIAIRELQALDDRLLKDIGISRSDIPFLIGRQLSAKRTAPAGLGEACEITAFPERQPTAPGSRALLRPAA